MEPVINPWLFYFIDVVGAIKTVGAILAFISLMALLISFLEEENGILVISFIVLIISSLIIIFVPSSDTLIKMTIAKNVTYDAVDAAKDVVIQVYNDILALFQK
nr:MAG TPA: hypothetical protein [Caudoviricetes sp.]